MVIKELRQSIIDGGHKVSIARVQQALSAGLAPDLAFNGGWWPPSEVGRRFDEGEYFGMEILIAARAMGEG